MIPEQFSYPDFYEYDHTSLRFDIHYPSSLLDKRPLNVEECEEIFVFGQRLSQNFYAGAEFYRFLNQNNMSVFMLHQSAEHALKTILRLHMRYALEIHMIGHLLKLGAIFSVQLNDIFNPYDAKDKRLLQILDNAYLDVRYSNDFSILDDELSILTDKTKHIYTAMQDVWKQIKK